MLKSVKEIIQKSVINTIKKEFNVTNQQIANSIGVHHSHIQKVGKGVRLLSKTKFENLCCYWDIDVDYFIKNIELKDQELLLQKSIFLMMKSKDLEHLSIKTGIPFLKLYEFQRGKNRPSAEETEVLATALKIDSRIITNGTIALGLELIENILKKFYFEPQDIDAVLKFIKREL